MPQLLKPTHLEPVVHNKRSHRNEKPAHRNKEWSLLATTREKSPHAATKTQHSQKEKRKKKRERKKTILFKLALKRKKYLGINLTKGVKDLYSDNYKTLKKKTEDNSKKYKDIHVHGLEELILLKCPHYPKRSTDLMQSLLKYP